MEQSEMEREINNLKSRVKRAETVASRTLSKYNHLIRLIEKLFAENISIFDVYFKVPDFLIMED